MNPENPLAAQQHVCPKALAASSATNWLELNVAYEPERVHRDFNELIMDCLRAPNGSEHENDIVPR